MIYKNCPTGKVNIPCLDWVASHLLASFAINLPRLLQYALLRGAGDNKVLRLNGKQVKDKFLRPVLPPQR